MLMHLSALSWPDRLGRTAQRWGLAWGRIFYLGAVVLVLVLSPSSYGRAPRRTLARHIYLDTAPVLVGFTMLAALLCVVVTHIVVVAALSYGLSRYAMEMLIRVLVLELIPLTATLFVAMRCTIPSGAQLARLRQSGHFAALRRAGGDPVRTELMPRVVALVMVYLSVYGFNAAGLPVYTRTFGQVFTPAVTLVFTLKTLFSSMAVALIPMTAGMYDTGQNVQPDSELGGLARMFAVLLLVEVSSLLGNYY